MTLLNTLQSWAETPNFKHRPRGHEPLGSTLFEFNHNPISNIIIENMDAEEISVVLGFNHFKTIDGYRTLRISFIPPITRIEIIGITPHVRITKT